MEPFISQMLPHFHAHFLSLERNSRRQNKVRRLEASLEAYRERLLPFVPGQTREEKLAKLQLLFSSMAGVLTMVRVISSPQRREQMVTEARKFFVKSFAER